MLASKPSYGLDSPLLRSHHNHGPKHIASASAGAASTCHALLPYPHPPDAHLQQLAAAATGRLAGDTVAAAAALVRRSADSAMPRPRNASLKPCPCVRTGQWHWAQSTAPMFSTTPLLQNVQPEQDFAKNVESGQTKTVQQRKTTFTCCCAAKPHAQDDEQGTGILLPVCTFPAQAGSWRWSSSPTFFPVSTMAAWLMAAHSKPKLPLRFQSLPQVCGGQATRSSE